MAMNVLKHKDGDRCYITYVLVEKITNICFGYISKHLSKHLYL